MTSIDHAENIIYEAITGDGFSAPELRTRHAARALANAGLLAPEPQVIRTRDELAALDPDTVLMTTDRVDPLTLARHWLDGEGNPARGTEIDIPAVVIATGEQVRAARQALEEADAVD